MNILNLIFLLAQQMNSSKKDHRTAARREIKGRAIGYFILAVITFMIALVFPILHFLALFFLYKSYKYWKARNNPKEIEKWAKKVAAGIYKHIDFDFKQDPSLITSFPQVKGSEVRYTTLKEAKELYSCKSQAENNKPIYIGHFTLSEIMEEYTPENIKNQVEKTPLCIKSLELTKGLVVLGKMGSGKSVLLKNILAQHFYNRAVINDVKGEYVSSFYRDGLDIIYNVFDARSKLWDIFGDVERNPALAQAIAEAVVETITKQKDFWLTAAATLFREALLHATFSVEEDKYNAFLSYIKQHRDKAVSEEDKTALSIHATLEPVMETFRILAWLEKQDIEKFSLYDFVESKDTRLFLLLDPAHEKAMKPLTNALLTALISILLSRPDTKEDFTLFLLDEFLSIRIPETIQTQLFTLARAKGIQLITASQYLSKDNERLVQNVLNSRQYLAVFPVADTYTLQILERIGEVEAHYQDTSMSYNLNFSKSTSIKDILSDVGSRSEGLGMQTKQEKQQFKLFSTKMIYQLPQYAFILNSTNPFSLLVAKVKDFYFNFEEKNEQFIERDLKDYYKSTYASQTS